MRLIDVEPLEGLIKQHLETTDSALFFSALSTFARLLEMTPTADAVPVVRCKDCFLYGECQAAKFYGDDGYCSCGERKDNE